MDDLLPYPRPLDGSHDMVDLTIFLARSFAIFYLVAGIGMLANAKTFSRYTKDLEKNKGAVFIASAFVLILGIILVQLHSVWTQGPELLVTLLCWLTFAKGSLFFLFPDHMFNLLKNWEAEITYKAAGGLVLVLGILFGYFGFYA